MNKQSVNKPRLMSHAQVYKYLGGCVGRDKLYSLMKDGTIKSAWLGGKLVADAGSVDEFCDSLFDRENEENKKSMLLKSKHAPVVLTNHSTKVIKF